MTAEVEVLAPATPDLLSVSPSDLLPGRWLSGTDVVEAGRSTLAEAKARAKRIYDGLVTYVQVQQDLADAYARDDWEVMGYGSWAEYMETEFGGRLRQVLGRDREARAQASADLRATGLSTRAIGRVLEVDQKTVRNDLDEVRKNSSPDVQPAAVTGDDGKQYPATRPEPESKLPPDAPAGARQQEPAPGDEVWVAAGRKGIDAHKPVSVNLEGIRYTGCNRSMRTGEVVKAAEAVERWGVKWCLKCWPIVYRIVFVRQDHEDPLEAELRQDKPSRSTVQVVYTRSRTSAWVVRDRIMPAVSTVSAPVLEAERPEPTNVGTPAAEAPAVLCENCGGALAAQDAADNWRRCGDCDPNGDHYGEPGEPCKACVPAVVTVRAPVLEAEPTPVVPREIPLADATWGMYGEVKGWGPGGSPAKHTGYITKPPRLYTGGAGGNHKKPKFKGEQMLSFVIDEPGDGDRAGMSIGMYARPDATFRVLDPPAGRPLTAKMYLGRRMPVVDLRARDTFHVWDEPGKPRMHLQADPVPAADGCYALVVLVDGQVTTRTLHGDDWVDVDDPERYPWQAAPAAVKPEPDERVARWRRREEYVARVRRVYEATVELADEDVADLARDDTAVAELEVEFLAFSRLLERVRELRGEA